MSGRLQDLYIEGLGFWASALPGWHVAREVLAGRAQAPAPTSSRPSPALLPPAERRRAPDTVAVALEVATRACENAGRDPKALPSVFASANGDLLISDAICDTLAKTPALTSPTKFHNSVHNAAAGYWTIATGCMKPYTALCGNECTFGQGVLEAATQALSEKAPVLLVAYDIESRGPIATMQPSRGVLAGALVLSTEKSDRNLARLRLEVRADASSRQSEARPENALLVAGNAMRHALPLFEALADGVECEMFQALAPRMTLVMRVTPVAAAGLHVDLLQRAR